MISSRFTVAVHILALVHINNGNVTSEYIASSVNTNPAVIRRIMSMLSKAGLISSQPGVIGIKLQHPIADISLLDVYKAVELPEKKELFTLHQNTNEHCVVGKGIQQALSDPLRDAQQQMEQSLSRTTIEQIVKKILRQEHL
ncbi:Rrf2 family transcriptional regulator [Paenibacillus sp. JDR-2]|uniref:Rrf2 family transcriptional regulator n=1 Tax=Paenibacillus sp. (strain JDR-2) TaxID=324057 RepID=UPI0001664A7A|nr:Rrf2 family transcriptional regulator [Paenibacillus sp. JDR-2]ACT03695.1 transcriptional regulator, BadM/Rrf2 family [Paenibacillus sp. JDR-2]